MNEAWQDVRDFHRAFSQPYEDAPVLLSRERAAKRAAWMLEEVGEFLVSKDVCEQADAMIDLIYFALGTLVEMGVRPGELFDIVHKANMTKLWEDGKPHYKADGKVIKPSSWQGPEPLLKAALLRQGMQDGQGDGTADEAHTP